MRAARLLAVAAALAVAVVGVHRLVATPSLEDRLTAALATKGPDYVPHTRHLLAGGRPKYTNRLILERSPYLLQHAHNPVDWYPWGDEAFARARDEHKPVLLSIGYSTCHWCHVMEAETFEDEEIAAYLNAHYVAVKVDREERPDIDAVYLNAVQLMTRGGGGWPMTLWLTPDRKPFYGGTYFPPRGGARGASFGFLELSRKLAEAYGADPARAEEAAADVAGRLEAAAAASAAAASGLPGPAVLARAYAEVAPTFDADHGGFGTRPKFPRPSQLLFLLRHHRRTGDPAALDMVVRTLSAMAAGGIHDQLGGGFHRYATDAAWRVPHFEKMLYDNALLTVAYLEGAQAAARVDFREVARGTLGYLQRDMAAPGGGFFAASDADSDGEEGKYFLWTGAEIAAVLGPDRGAAVAAYFDVGDAPTTLAVSAPTAPSPALDAGELASARAALLAARGRRVPPHVDRKVVVAWNGLAVSAFARGAVVLDEPELAGIAARTAAALLDARTDGRLPRFLAGGGPNGDGYLDDYAFLEAGLLDLYEATSEPRWLADAMALQAVLDERFADPRGGYFLTAADQERLLTREKPDYDGAEPAGNSVAALNLLRLHELTADDRYRARADALLTAFGTALATRPDALPHLLAALAFRLARVREVVLVSPDGAAALAPFRRVLATTFAPDRVLTVVTGGRASPALARLVPLAADKTPLGGRSTAYVCERRVCKLPTTDPAVFAGQLAAP